MAGGSASTLGRPWQAPGRAALAAAGGRWAPRVLLALAGAALVWTRVIALGQSMFDDELYTVVNYVTPGPSAIFGHYVPNDHVLFELVTWATVNVLGGGSNAIYRFWGVAPALAAVALMTWWLYRRRDPWVAATFAVLGASAPVQLAYGTQARGYGLAFLAGVMLVIGAVRVKEERSPGALALFCTGSLIGIWTLPVFALTVIAVAAPLFRFRDLRRLLVITLAGLALVTLLFYAPVLSQIIGQAGQHYGSRLSWAGFVVGPLRDQLAPSLQLLLPGASPTVTEIVGAVLVILGIVALVHRWERVIAVVFTSSVVTTYLLLEAGRFYVATRFACFVLLPMLAVVAVGIVETGRIARRVRGVTTAGAIALMVVSLLLLSKLEKLATTDARAPQENTQEASAILTASGLKEPIVSNSRRRIGLDYYLGSTRYLHVLMPSALVTVFCSTQTPFVYVEHGLHSPLADTTCLRSRDAVRIVVPQRVNAVLAVWFVPAMTSGR